MAKPSKYPRTVKAGTYCFECKGRIVYLGQAVRPGGVHERWARHWCEADFAKRKGKRLSRLWAGLNKYGREGVKLHILSEIQITFEDYAEERAFAARVGELEMEMIGVFETFSHHHAHGWNLTLGGIGGSGQVSPLTREERSDVVCKGWAKLTKEQKRQRALDRVAKMTPEQKAIAAAKCSATRKAFSTEKKAAILEKQMAAMTDEERSEVMRRRMAAMTDEERAAWRTKISASRTTEQRSEAGRKVWAAMSPEQREVEIAALKARSSSKEQRQKLKKAWDVMTPEAKAARNEKVRQAKLRYWANVPEEERSRRLKHARRGQTPESQAQHKRQWWASLPPKERTARAAKFATAGGGRKARKAA